MIGIREGLDPISFNSLVTGFLQQLGSQLHKHRCREGTVRVMISPRRVSCVFLNQTVFDCEFDIFTSEAGKNSPSSYFFVSGGSILYDFYQKLELSRTMV